MMTDNNEKKMPEFVCEQEIKKKVKRVNLRIRIVETLYQNKGWTMKCLADRMGVDYQTILFWNRGTSHPKLSSLVQLARLLQCPLDELVEKMGA